MESTQSETQSGVTDRLHCFAQSFQANALELTVIHNTQKFLPVQSPLFNSTK
jgi:hypothetical protein